MSGVELLKRCGLVDESRIAVSGWSYGGFMTAWLTAHYPNSWTAAVAGAPVTDWFDYYSMSDLNTWTGSNLDGSPWLNRNAENYWRQSSITYAHQIRTPTLILSTTGDERVPISQSYKLYHALKVTTWRCASSPIPSAGISLVIRFTSAMCSGAGSIGSRSILIDVLTHKFETPALFYYLILIMLGADY